MTGRGIDQALRYPCEPTIYESYVKSAKGYVQLAEHHHGKLKLPLEFHEIWGDALDELKQVKPDLRVINLETSVTTNNEPADKGINYRMNPAARGDV